MPINSKIKMIKAKTRGFRNKERFKTAILSGGFTYFAEYLQKELGIDYVHANQLEIKDGALTGNYIGEIVDGNKKAEYLNNRYSAFIVINF